MATSYESQLLICTSQYQKWYTLSLYKHMGKLGWSSKCLRICQFEPEMMLDGMLNFKTHFIWYEHCNGLCNIQSLVSSLILIF